MGDREEGNRLERGEEEGGEGNRIRGEGGGVGVVAVIGLTLTELVKLSEGAGENMHESIGAASAHSSG